MFPTKISLEKEGKELIKTLKRLPITRDLSPSKDSDKAAFWWTSIRKAIEIILNSENISREQSQEIDGWQTL